MKNENTEELILAAALEEFAEKGFHGARMQTIANRAGVNKALLHYYFRSKEQLYMTVLEPIGVAFCESVEPRVGTLDPGDIRGLARILATFVVTEGKRAPFSYILITELASGGHYLKKMQRGFLDALESLQNTVFDFIQAGIDNGRIKPFHPMKIFSNIMGMCWNIYLLAPMSDIIFERAAIPKDEAFYKDYIDLIVEMSSAGLALPQ